jgi:hypothetical protein
LDGILAKEIQNPEALGKVLISDSAAKPPGFETEKN